MSLPAVNLHLVWEFPSHVWLPEGIALEQVVFGDEGSTEHGSPFWDEASWLAGHCSTLYTHHIHHSWQWPICWKLKFLLSMMMRPVKEHSIEPKARVTLTITTRQLHSRASSFAWPFWLQATVFWWVVCWPGLYAAPPADSLSQSTHRWCWFPAALVQKRCRCQSPDSWPRPGAMDRIGPPLPTATVTAPKRKG